MNARIGPKPTSPTLASASLREYLSAEAWAERDFPPYQARGVPQVAIGREPVVVKGETLSPIWWRGRQWAVTAYGIERLDGSYVIAADRVAEHLDDRAWPLHMARKSWVEVDEFATAWTIALLLHGHSAKVAADQVLKLFAKLPPWPEDAA